ncbi:hypothetical protein, partial [Brachybacterium tyrofermentans]|uniref:hypothetical protein n=1 Tax=Brachybacterium tyrofermentans TaxID=47848 RepID=UPI001D02036E
MPIQILDDLTPELAQCIWETGICAVDTETSGLDWRTDRLEICQLFTPSTGVKGHRDLPVGGRLISLFA